MCLFNDICHKLPFVAGQKAKRVRGTIRFALIDATTCGKRCSHAIECSAAGASGEFPVWLFQTPPVKKPCHTPLGYQPPIDASVPSNLKHHVKKSAGAQPAYITSVARFPLPPTRRSLQLPPSPLSLLSLPYLPSSVAIWTSLVDPGDLITVLWLARGICFGCDQSDVRSFGYYSDTHSRLYL